MNKSIKNLLAVSALVLTSMSAQAGLIVGHESFDEQATYTVDIGTGLEWLDLNAAILLSDVSGYSLSYNEVINSDFYDKNNDDSSKWRHATKAEFGTLMENWFTNINSFVLSHTVDSTESTDFNTVFGGKTGQLYFQNPADFTSADMGRVAYLKINNSSPVAFDYFAQYTGNNIVDTNNQWKNGTHIMQNNNVNNRLDNGVLTSNFDVQYNWSSHFLVRDNVAEDTSKATDVPEPASIAIFGLALAGLSISRKKSLKR